MSTPSTSSTPSATATPSVSSSTGNSNLYLFTFLATLILLLTVSCSIICRAVFMRRRFRRRVDRAMAQGLVLTPPEQGSHNLSFGAQPKLFDVWLTDLKNPSSSWADITPISAQPLPGTDSEHFSTFGSSVSSKLPSTIRSAPSTVRSEAPPEYAAEALQVSVLVAMPQAPATEKDQLPEVAFGFTHSLYPSS
ncbi:hypothetical protein C8R43DRAFT_1010936 [Mycena crocata]|nr:hypothetical protein C8R43DRAFT_1010936 [Mycena crocata]